MPIDASIPEGIQPIKSPDLISQATNLMQLKFMGARIPLEQAESQEKQIQLGDIQDTRDAMSGNMKPDPTTGTPTLDMAGTLADLNTRNPRAGMALRAQMVDQQTKQIQNSRDAIAASQGKLTLMGSLAGSVTDQDSLDSALTAAKTSGLDTSKMPTEYNAQTAKRLQQITSMAQTAKDQTDNMFRKQGLMQTQTQDARKGADDIQHLYNEDDQTKEFSQVAAASRQGATALQQAGEALRTGKETGPSDLAALTAFAKMENPNISPRLQTIDLATFQRSVPADIYAKFSEAFTGGSMSPSQREALHDLMESRLEDSRLSQMQTDARYESVAYKQGLDPEWAGVGQTTRKSSYDVTPNPFATSSDKRAMTAPGAKAKPDLSTIGAAPAAATTTPQSTPTASNRTVTGARAAAIAKAQGIDLETAKSMWAKQGIKVQD